MAHSPSLPSAAHLRSLDGAQIACSCVPSAVFLAESDEASLSSSRLSSLAPAQGRLASSLSPPEPRTMQRPKRAVAAKAISYVDTSVSSDDDDQEQLVLNGSSRRRSARRSRSGDSQVDAARSEGALILLCILKRATADPPR